MDSTEVINMAVDMRLVLPDERTHFIATDYGGEQIFKELRVGLKYLNFYHTWSTVILDSRLINNEYRPVLRHYNKDKITPDTEAIVCVEDWMKKTGRSGISPIIYILQNWKELGLSPSTKIYLAVERDGLVHVIFNVKSKKPKWREINFGTANWSATKDYDEFYGLKKGIETIAPVTFSELDHTSALSDYRGKDHGLWPESYDELIVKTEKRARQEIYQRRSLWEKMKFPLFGFTKEDRVEIIRTVLMEIGKEREREEAKINEYAIIK